jgi:endonuclease VIII
MPEGHTIHRLARDLQADLGGQVVRAWSPQGRFAAGAERIDGALLVSTEAWGKHLFTHFDVGEVLHIHLGLIGKLRRQAEPVPDPVGMVRLRIEGDASAWDLSGPMICAVITPDAMEAVASELGPDPLRRDADPERFVQRVLRSKKPIGNLVLDQDVIAGIGNVYRAEVLWALGIHPAREGRSLTRDDALAIWRWMVDALRLGVRRNRIVTVDPKELGVPLARISREDAVNAYHRSQCRRCSGPITPLELGGRRIDVCPRCQT